MNDRPPIVSVVMAVHNGGKYLCAAVESILAQSFRDFELIAIDDGSTDDSAAILERYCQQDDRIMIVSHSKNLGIVSSLNEGLKKGRGKYIARMDADDVCFPERLERQVGFLESHPEVGVLGTDILLIDSQGKELTRITHGHGDFFLHWIGLFANIFFHPTVMIRRVVLIEYNLGYQSNFQTVEDYDLGVHLLEHTQAENLDQPLVRYRVHSESISSQFEQEQIANHNRISYAAIQRTMPEIKIPPEEHAMLVAAFSGRLSPSLFRHRPALARRYLELWQAFELRNRGNPQLIHLRHEAVILGSKIGLYPPFQPGWLETIICLFKADPAWVFFFVKKFPEMIRLKRLGIRLRRLRKVV